MNKLTHLQLRGFAYLCAIGGGHAAQFVDEDDQKVDLRPPSRATVKALQKLGLIDENGHSLTMLGHATGYRVLGPRCGECDDCQEWHVAKQDAAACMPKAIDVAKYCGAEFAANPGSSSNEYKADMALRVGYATWAEVPSWARAKLMKAFAEGRREEERSR